MSADSTLHSEPAPQPRVYRPSAHSAGYPAAGGGRGNGPDGRAWFREDDPAPPSPEGRSFAALLGLTTLGALLPGAGLIAAGRRRVGTLILATVFWTFVAVAVAVALDLHERLAVRPNAIRLLAAGLVAGGFVWALVIATSHLSLRRGRLRIWQQLVSGLLVVGLMSMALFTTATAARYGMEHAGLISSVFGGEGRAPLALKGGAARVNVLLLGSDAGDGRVGVRPDTIIVASIDTASGDTVMFTLPRNLQNVPFPSGTPGARAWPNGFNCGDECLINAVWKWGEENPGLFPGDVSPGLTATRQAVSAALGLPLHYYAMVNLDGFKDVVDAMGGVTLDVPRPLPIGGGTNAAGQKNPIRGYIQPGLQRLNGDQALWYARSREGSDDYDRMKRQRCFLDAVVEQGEPRKLARAFPALARAARDNIRTDIAQAELDDWVRLAQRVQKAQVRSLPFTNEVITPANPDFVAIRGFVADSLRTPGAKAAQTAQPEPAPAQPRVSAAPSQVRVRVLNGTDQQGLAARTAAELAEQGFVIAGVGDAGANVPATVVRHDPAYDESGRTVASAVGASQQAVAGLGGVITLVVGPDFTRVQPVVVTSAPSPSTPRTEVPGAGATPSVAAQTAETCG